MNTIPGGLPLAPAVADLNGFFVPLLATVTCQVNAQEVKKNILRTHVEHIVETSGKKKNRVKNLHKSTIKMLLFASAMDNETVPLDLTDSCKRVINSKIVALAEQELNLQFENRGLSKVSFLMGYTSNMYNGILLWSSTDTPSNHSQFTFNKAEPIRMDKQKNRHLTLQLILMQGKGIMVDEIKAANKQEVHAPMNFQDMTEQLQMFTITNNIFLGELSVGSQCLRTLQTMIDCNRSTFKAHERLDEQFYSKFLFAIKSRFQIWLKQCRNAKNCNKVNKNTINFMPVVSQVLFGSFHINLLSTFQMKIPPLPLLPPQPKPQHPTGKTAAATRKVNARRKKMKTGP